MASKFKINLDISKDSYLVVKSKQNDDLIMEASMFEYGQKLDISNKTIDIKALKADNTYIIQSTNIIKNNNKITVELERDFTRVPGKTKIEIVLKGSGKQNTTFSFYLEVIGSVIDGAIESSNTVTILENLENKIVEAVQVKEETEQLIQSGGAATKGDIQEVNSQLEQKADKRLIPVVLKQDKNFNVKNTNKIVIKENDDSYKFIQKTNIGYLLYHFHKNNGDNSNTSVGGKFDLLRLKKVSHLSDCYVYLKPSVINGTLTAFNEPSTNNTPESELFNTSYFNLDNTIAENSEKKGLGLYYIDASQSVTFTIKTSDINKNNILIRGSNGSSESVDILVNGAVIKNINTRSYRIDDSTAGYSLLELDIPKNRLGKDIQITLRNNDTSRKFYMCCFNFYNLEDYKGQYVDSYKGFGTRKVWIDAVGASDYAILDADLNKFCGSYHGGESAIEQRMIYKNNLVLFNSIPIGWSIEKSFYIYQNTNINNKGDMVSIFDLNNDGTLDMSFSFQNGTIRAKQFYTALTCTQPHFKAIKYPLNKTIPDDAETKVDMNNFGYISQYSSYDGIKLDIKFDLFNNMFNKKYPNILQNSNYSKFYYGVIQDMPTAEAPIVSQIQFNKSLDFIVL